MPFCMGIETFVNSISHMAYVHGGVANKWDDVYEVHVILCGNTNVCFVFPSFELVNSISKILFRKLFCLRMKMSWIFPIAMLEIYSGMRINVQFPQIDKKVATVLRAHEYILHENFLFLIFLMWTISLIKAISCRTGSKMKWNEFHHWDKCQKWNMIAHHLIRTQRHCLPTFSKLKNFFFDQLGRIKYSLIHIWKLTLPAFT